MANIFMLEYRHLLFPLVSSADGKINPSCRFIVIAGIAPFAVCITEPQALLAHESRFKLQQRCWN